MNQQDLPRHRLHVKILQNLSSDFAYALVVIPKFRVHMALGGADKDQSQEQSAIKAACTV